MVAGVRWSRPHPGCPETTKRHGLIRPCRSVSGNRGGGDGNRTRVQGFAGPCLSHSATPPQGACRKGIRTFESGRRDSNPRPSPWQGDALPTEPRPQPHPWGAIRTVADPAAHANSDRLPMSSQVSGIFRVCAHSGHGLRDPAPRPGPVAGHVPCDRTRHFHRSVTVRCWSKDT